MFQHMFMTMHKQLDGIMRQYPTASEQERQQFELQLSELKKASDCFIELWLNFEEKLSQFQQKKANDGGNAVSVAAASAQQGSDVAADESQHEAAAHAPGFESMTCSAADLYIPDDIAGDVSKGQGYYKLFMFPQAATIFHDVLAQAPECNLARLYLGMSLMHTRSWNEAQRQFQLLIVLSDFPKWLALGYNALGCIQAIHMNLAQAEKLFKKAYEVYPGFADSLSNLKSCQETPKQLSLYFGSTELCCM
ncbi:hypothetical protein M6D81_06290 [Paenibacillus sp. J5C_2022]|uniref:hypothetical protein n=1 Tax=Paenibacillus sp. J5C2022 TaxID=2977129 RepID=UPI0021D2B65C|nr:hypothetical protein [Paenibacillus sp. J5C2022]MCU6708319.1 hypothetical protein [Paenibacillus sp. J5C2022]